MSEVEETALKNAVEIWGAPEDIPISELVFEFWIQKTNCIDQAFIHIKDWYVIGGFHFDSPWGETSFATSLFLDDSPCGPIRAPSITEDYLINELTAAYAFSLITDRGTLNSDDVCMFKVLDRLGISVGDHMYKYDDMMHRDLKIETLIQEITKNLVNVDMPSLSEQRKRALSCFDHVKSRVDKAIVELKAEKNTSAPTAVEEFESDF